MSISCWSRPNRSWIQLHNLDHDVVRTRWSTDCNYRAVGLSKCIFGTFTQTLSCLDPCPPMALSRYESRLGMNSTCMDDMEGGWRMTSTYVDIIPINPWANMSQYTLLRKLTSSSVNPKSGTSHLGHIRMSSAGIHVPYIQLAAYITYCVIHSGPMFHVYVPTSLTRMLLYPFELTCTCPRTHESRFWYQLLHPSQSGSSSCYSC
jgi:hypothetical protein